MKLITSIAVGVALGQLGYNLIGSALFLTVL